MELFKLFGSIFVDNEKANQSIHKTEEKAEGLGNKLLKGVGTAAKWGAGIAAAAVGAVGGMVALASKTAEAADYIDKLSERTGVSREELQRWKYAADQSGADVGKLEVGIKKLSTTMDGAAKGSKSSVAAFEALGISMDEVTSKSPSEMLDTVMKKLAEMPDSAERNALGNQLLGKSYSDMLPLLNAGAKGIDDLKNRADELGLVMSEESVKANVKFADTLADVKNSLGAVVNNLMTALLPVLQTVLDFILDHMPEIQSVITVVFQAIGQVVNVAIEILKSIGAVLSSFFDNSTEQSKEFQGFITETVAWLGEIFETIKEIAEILWKELSAFWKEYGDDILAVTKIIFGAIKIAISTALDLIKSIIKFWTSVLKGDWQGAWDAIKEYVNIIFEAIAKILPNLIKALITIITGFASGFLDAGKALFNGLWDGIKSVWSGISSWVSDKVNWLVDKLKFWENSKAKLNAESIDDDADGSHATGLSYVPFDGYRAILHRGERVLTAEENESYNKKQAGDIHQHITINSPRPLNPSETARQMKKAARQLALDFV